MRPALPLFLLCPNSGKSSGFPVVLSVKAAWSGPECPWWSRVDADLRYRCRKCGNVFEEWVKTLISPSLSLPQVRRRCRTDCPIRLSSLKAAAGSRPATAGKRPVPPVMPPRLRTRPRQRLMRPPRRRRRLPPVRVGVPRRLRPDFLRRGRLPAPFSYSFCEEIP